MNVVMEVDASEVEHLIKSMESVLTPERFQRVMYGIYKRTGSRVKKILREDIPQKYEAQSGEISKVVKNPKISGGITGGYGCTIPLVDTRKKHSHGRNHTFPARGGAHGWEIPKKGYKVKVKILKGQYSTLPETIPAIGWKPFRNYNADRLNQLIFARTSDAPDAKIKPVTGIAIPQMPMNRARPEVEKDIEHFFEERVYHEFDRLIGTIR